MIDFAAQTRPSSPNAYMIAPPGFAAAYDGAAPSPVFQASVDEVSAALDQVLAGEARLKEIARSADGLQRHVTQTSQLMRFVDDIDIAIVSQDVGLSVAIYSRSRVGYSDLGVNEKRVRRILSGLETHLPLLSGAPSDTTSVNKSAS